MSLTGRFTFRKTLGGKIVLQVEEEVSSAWWPFAKEKTRKRWRDANTMDLAQAEMRALMDLRHKPQFMPQRYYTSANAAGETRPDPTVETSAMPPKRTPLESPKTLHL